MSTGERVSGERGSGERVSGERVSGERVSGERGSGAHLAYVAAFAALLASVIVLGVASVSLLRSEPSTSRTLFWVSIALSVAAVVGAIVAVLRSRARR